MNIGVISLSAPSAAESKQTGGQRVQDAARDFEALLLTLMLKTMREASGSTGWLGTGEDQSGSSMMELAEQQVAQALAASGGLGLATLVEEGLKKPETRASSSR